MLGLSARTVKPAENNVAMDADAHEPTLKNILLCKKAYLDDNRHNVYEGEFRTLGTPKIPAVAEEIFVVTKWGDGAGRGFKQEIKIFEPEGSLEVFTSGDLEKEFKLSNIYHEHLITGRVTGLLLPEEGRYRIEVYLNGRLKGKAYFNVVLNKAKETVFADFPEPAHEPEKGAASLPFPIPIPLPMPFRLSLNYFKFARD